MDFFKIDPNSYTPVYIQIQDGIRNAINSGILTPGQQLPSVRELAKTIKTNPNTVAKALKNLVIQEVLVSRQGLGCFVNTETPSDDGAIADPTKIPRFPSQDSSSASNVVLTGDSRSGMQPAEELKTPIYIKIRNDFLSKILDGSLRPGSQLPSVRELASQYNVNENTAIKALNELKLRGYICSMRGLGYHVNASIGPQVSSPDAASPDPAGGEGVGE
jgi:DNA-binding transcriptional regulator YhcF (GntR family)